MYKLIFSIIFLVLLSTSQAFATFDKTLSVSDDNMTYEIPYSMDRGTINDAILNCEEGSLSLFMTTTDNGILILDFPNNLFHSIFMMFVNGEEFTDGATIDGNILTINYPKNTKNMEILSSFALTEEKNDGVCERHTFKHVDDNLVDDDIVEKPFVIDGYTITTFSNHVTDISLNWNSKDLEFGSITLDEPINGTVKISIPKSMPRLTNLDFGHFGLHAIQTDESWNEIKEIESNCFYHLEIPVNDSDYLEIVGSSVAAGRWEPVSIMNQECGDFSLKQQIENKMTVDEIECRNEKHVLVQRENEQLACISPVNAEKLDWKIISLKDTLISSVYQVEAKIEPIFSNVDPNVLLDIPYTIKGGTIESMQHDYDANSLLVLIDSNFDGFLTVNVPQRLLNYNSEQLSCGIFTLVDGEEVAHDITNTRSGNKIVTLNFTRSDPLIEIIGTWGSC